jgi:hypothetical protein
VGLETKSYANKTTMLANATVEIGIAVFYLSIHGSKKINFEPAAETETLKIYTANLAPVRVTSFTIE